LKSEILTLRSDILTLKTELFNSKLQPQNNNNFENPRTRRNSIVSIKPQKKFGVNFLNLNR
jgi:hypothetical protein